MLLCDCCGSEWHMGCLCPRVEKVPGGTWECWKCWKGKGGEVRRLDVGEVEGEEVEGGGEAREEEEVRETDKKRDKRGEE